MVVITGICLVAQADVVRYRPLLLVLAAGKTASSLGSLAFFLITNTSSSTCSTSSSTASWRCSRSGSGCWPAAIGRPVDPG